MAIVKEERSQAWWWCTQEAEAGGSLEFEANLDYRVTSKTARDIQRNPISKRKKRGLGEGRTC
ncbi:hypothetical protein ACRRTK_009787 [Alexandromys fortis]